MKSFLSSLSVGKNGELAVIELLNDFGYSASKYDETKDYDIFFEYKKKKVYGEVKNDVMAEKTGNFAIEFWNVKKNTASGISNCKSHLWFHIAANQIWMANTQDLKTYTEQVAPKRIITMGGDANASLKLYPLAMIGEIFSLVGLTQKKTEFAQILKKTLKF